MYLLDYVPFTYRRDTDICDSDEEYKVDFKSITQGLIIAVATGLISMYATQTTLKVQLDAIQSDVEQIKHKQTEFRKDFYIPRR